MRGEGDNPVETELVAGPKTQQVKPLALSVEGVEKEVAVLGAEGERIPSQREQTAEVCTTVLDSRCMGCG
jgi:hypothetical protein